MISSYVKHARRKLWASPGLKTDKDFAGQVWKKVWKMTFFGLN